MSENTCQYDECGCNIDGSFQPPFIRKESLSNANGNAKANVSHELIYQLTLCLEKSL